MNLKQIRKFNKKRADVHVFKEVVFSLYASMITKAGQTINFLNGLPLKFHVRILYCMPIYLNRLLQKN